MPVTYVQWCETFQPELSVDRWAKRNHLQTGEDSVNRFGRNAYTSTDTRMRVINTILRLVLRLLGAGRDTILMKYFEYASILRNQKDVLHASRED